MRRRWLAVAAALAVTGAGCSSGDHAAHSDVAEGRLVTMAVTDALRFEPATVDAKAGEKVTFRIANGGSVDHEFVIGDASFQQMHRDQMASASAGAGHGGHAEVGTAVAVPAGQTVNVTVTMPDLAPTYACYVNRHADAGMVGRVAYPS